MSEPMPLSDFRWLSDEEIQDLDISKMTSEQDEGYILEVDLVVPPSIHRQHNSYPLAPEHVTITKDMLSPYALSCHEMLNGSKDYRASKLCGTFLPKEKYCVHYMNLKASSVDNE